MKACVVVPTYNEKANISALVQRLRSGSIKEMEVLFVDDSSPDGTADAVRQEAAADSSIRLLVRPEKKGIGSAYIDGFRVVLKGGAEAVLEMDADMQHPPEKAADLVEAVARGADVAVASRYVEGGGSAGWGLGRRAVSRGANWLARNFLGLSVRDCTSGFRAYSRRAAEKLVETDLPVSGFEFQVAALRALKGMKVVEVPYVFEPRQRGRSKLGAAGVARFFWYVVTAALRSGLQG